MWSASHSGPLTPEETGKVPIEYKARWADLNDLEYRKIYFPEGNQRRFFGCPDRILATVLRGLISWKQRNHEIIL
jgi:hypothetical protein